MLDAERVEPGMRLHMYICIIHVYIACTNSGCATHSIAIRPAVPSQDPGNRSGNSYSAARRVRVQEPECTQFTGCLATASKNACAICNARALGDRDESRMRKVASLKYHQDCPYRSYKR